MDGVADSITQEIAQLRVGEIAPGLAALAVSLARSVENPGNATAQSNAARELRAVMQDLRKLAPAAEEADRLDELAKKREGRISARRA